MHEISYYINQIQYHKPWVRKLEVGKNRQRLLAATGSKTVINLAFDKLEENTRRLIDFVACSGLFINITLSCIIECHNV